MSHRFPFTLVISPPPPHFSRRLGSIGLLLLVIFISPVEAFAQNPGKPTNVTSKAGHRQITLSWNAPTNTGNSSWIAGYQIQIRKGNFWNVVQNLHTSTSYTHRNLSPGTGYSYRIKSVNGKGRRGSHVQISVTTKALSAPVAPTGLTATLSGSTQVNLSWTAPSDDGGAAITGYRIETSANAGTTWSEQEDDTESTATAYEHTGLTPGTTYHYRVSAINSAGTGNPSNVDHATTGTATQPDAPTGLSATASGRTQINLSWTAPLENGGAAITGYRIETSTNAGTTWSEQEDDTESTATAYEHTGLTPGTTYHYRVSAINSAGTSTSSTVDHATTEAISAPQAPTGLDAQVQGRTQINLSWTAPLDNGGAAITGYRIETSTNAGTSWSEQDGNTVSTATAYEHTGLTPGTTYHYRVSANKSSSTVTPSTVDNATTEALSAPQAPTGLDAQVQGRTQINLSWTAPSNNGGAAITGYRIETSTNAGTTWSEQENDTESTVTAYEHTGLTPGTTYHYRVSAINSVGTGTPSNADHATTSAATQPDAPTGLSASASGRTQINLSWTAPSNNGGATITGYRIETSTNAGTTWSEQEDDTESTATAYEHTGLTPGTTYHYRVSAINSAGTGTPSNVDNATTSTATQPGAPTGLSATASGRTQINLSWTAPSNNGGAAITGYRIETSTNAGTTWSEQEDDTESTATAYEHTGLTPGTTYHYRVFAINSAGTGNPSNVDNATTAGTATQPDAPTGLSATASGRTAISLSWTAPSDDGGATITGYQIELSTNAGSNWSDLMANTGTTSTTYTHTGLLAATTYHYRISAINSVGTGNPSNVDHATTDAASAPDAPTGLTATASGRTAINLSWTAPSDDGGGAITGYQIELSADAGSDWSDLVANTGTTSTTYTHTGLLPGTTYHYRISAINSAGTGNPSNIDNATTDAASVPDAPTGLAATASGQTSIVLSWAVPSNDGGATVTGYQIEMSTDAGANWSDLVANTESSATTYTHTGIPEGATRHYRVYAINSIGASDPSNVANATTGAAITRPGAPAELTATASGRTQIHLFWTAPANNGGTAITGYRIETSPDAGSNWSDLAANTESSATTYTHTGLPESATRHYRVYAINSVGESADPSNVANATTDALSVPDAPTKLTASVSGETEINLSWTAPVDDGGATISGYQIEGSADAGETWADLVADTETTTTTYTHTGLQPGSTHHYRIRAINSVGAGDPSNVAHATTVILVSAPGVPVNVEAQADGQDAISLSWSAPLEDGGSAVTGYQVDVSEDAGTIWQKLAEDVTTTSYRHTQLPPGSTRHYRILARNAAGLSTPSMVVTATTDEDKRTSIAPLGEEVPADFSLEQNYPNPFNPSTAIEFSLTRTGQVTLTVYDLLGQKVQTLLDGVQPAGRHSVLFSGSGLANDTYLYVLQTQQQRAVKMMTLLK